MKNGSKSCLDIDNISEYRYCVKFVGQTAMKWQVQIGTQKSNKSAIIFCQCLTSLEFCFSV